MFLYVKNKWLSISLKKKLGFFAAAVILVMGLSAAFNIRVMNFALGGFNVILDDNSRCHDFQEAMTLEVKAFETYVREKNEENRGAYVLACVRTERCIRSLPFDYNRIGKERYARTWNVKNSYESYSIAREAVLGMSPADADYVTRLYKVYAMQDYIQDYGSRLVQVTLKEGNARYQENVSIFYKIPYLILLISAVMIAVVLCLTKIMSNTLINPLVKLAYSTRKIAANDFSEEDLTIANRDEMGEMVGAFNKMKHATKGYIDTLKENNEMAELLHKEELEKVDMEKRLDAARLDLLKSQINPHFLFNTLNMISCMAQLEEAGTTERMINSLSNLFRYNLKTSEQTVPLESELRVVKDYMYLQQMRFGGRIRYDLDIGVDAARVMVPAFTLQPVVENAIIHGISKKEQGGRIHIRAWMKGSALFIAVADTGLGMDQETRDSLLEALKEKRTSRVGIGLGNIYQRIHTMYQGGSLELYSTKGHGTVIIMQIPQEETIQ